MNQDKDGDCLLEQEQQQLEPVDGSYCIIEK
jgi:hypothetical protein